VDFGCCFSGVGAHDSSDVLNEASFECDGCGEEKCIERWAVEAFAYVGAGGPDEQRRFGGLRVEPAQGGDAGFGAHGPAKYYRVVTSFVQEFGEVFEVSCPLGEDQTVSTAFERIHHVAEDLLVAALVGCELSVDRGDAPRC
jgi:hypothetical protein